MLSLMLPVMSSLIMFLTISSVHDVNLYVDLDVVLNVAFDVALNVVLHVDLMIDFTTTVGGVGW